MADTPEEKNVPKENKAIVFLHPDLGIGGAERLVIDAAVGLQKRGHRIVIFTSHCDPKHCFDEARDGTLDVRVRGNTIVPPTILGRFAILCAVARQLHLLVQIALISNELASLQPDAFFVDQLSAGLPFLRWLATPRQPWRIFFYCHFPDLLLVRGRERWWKRLYRVPFDAWEQWSMGFADAVAVNSRFTRGVVAQTWPSLASSVELKVVYPCIPVPEETEEQSKTDEAMWPDTKVLLSINRFERKKDVALAIRAFARLPKEKRHGARLVIAGGYDPRVAENVLYHTELTTLAASLDLQHATVRTLPTALTIPASTDVLFFLSAPTAARDALLRTARALIYTPANEHFGIVPLEAMRARTPVLAAASGGPVETVVDGRTGWLRDAGDVDAWAAVMDAVLNGLSSAELARMGDAGRERVRTQFAEGIMAERLDGIFAEMERMPDSAAKGTGRTGQLAVVAATAVFVALVAVAAVWVIRS